MGVRILDLDGSVRSQEAFVARHRPAVLPAQEWGPRIRMACSFGRFRKFEEALAQLADAHANGERTITFCGSGDFHHVSLALLGAVKTPVSLVVLDNHPDWMRGVPFMHCGTWLYHAARLPQVERIYHIGGDVDFDNYYQSMAPWHLLRTEKIIVIPGVRRFERRSWRAVRNEPLRLPGQTALTFERIEQLLDLYRADLASRPVYISLDKDVMTVQEGVVNWDSGHLALDEVFLVLSAVLRCAGEKLAAMDVLGDWSPVVLRGWLRHFMHWTEHPALAVNPGDATGRNARVNLAIVDQIDRLAA